MKLNELVFRSLVTLRYPPVHVAIEPARWSLLKESWSSRTVRFHVGQEGISDCARRCPFRSEVGREVAGRTLAVLIPTQATSTMDEFYDLEAGVKHPKRLEKKIRHCLGKLVEYEHWANIRGTFTGRG